MSKLKEILNGWTNYVFQTPEIEKLAKDRAVHCSTCPINSGNTCSKRVTVIHNNKPVSGCGCPLPGLLRSKNSTCKLGKW